MWPFDSASAPSGKMFLNSTDHPANMRTMNFDANINTSHVCSMYPAKTACLSEKSKITTTHWGVDRDSSLYNVENETVHERLVTDACCSRGRHRHSHWRLPIATNHLHEIIRQMHNSVQSKEPMTAVKLTKHLVLHGIRLGKLTRI